MASPVMGRAGCPGRDPDYPKPAGTWMGVGACIHDSNSLGDRAKVVAEANAGTWEQGRKFALANSR